MSILYDWPLIKRAISKSARFYERQLHACLSFILVHWLHAQVSRLTQKADPYQPVAVLPNLMFNRAVYLVPWPADPFEISRDFTVRVIEIQAAKSPRIDKFSRESTAPRGLQN